jgi:DNA-binding response OmpR family regulator
MEKQMKILVVDDDPSVRFATVRLLAKAGYSVAEAETGTEGLRLIHETHPDLVLLDVILPDMDGYAVCRKIKTDQNLKDTYVLMASGARTASDEQAEGLEIGADGYIARPIPNRELLARIQSICRIILAERERDRVIDELQLALATIKTLRKMLPICASCKKIRDDTGYWQALELYFKKHSDVQFTHGICPECEQRLYPEPSKKPVMP